MVLNPAVREMVATTSAKYGHRAKPVDLELFDLFEPGSSENELREMADILGIPITLASLSPVHALRERAWNAFRAPMLKPRIGVRAATQHSA